MRDYPAYGRTIATHIVRGQKPICVAVMLSNGWWHHFNHAPKVCIKADEWALGRWEFGYLRGLHVVAIYGDCAAQQFGELLVDLMSAGPSRIWAYDLHGTSLTPGDPFLIDQQALGVWVHEMGAMRVSDPRLRKAREIFRLSKSAAEIEVYDTVGKIAQRGGDHLRWHAEQGAILDRVRRMFAAPFQEASERAAG